MTGVTIVTMTGPDGSPRGFTANSFTSVSLDPPLLLVCISKTASSCGPFTSGPGFAVNILAEQQKEASGIFASKRGDKFSSISWRRSAAGHPLIDGAVAWFDCSRHDVVDAGDHVILIGKIEDFAHRDANPLGYARGGYISLGLEQVAVNAASQGRTVVGAILESDGKLVLVPGSNPGTLTLPEVGRGGPVGSASLLKDVLARRGIDASIGFLFAVFETPHTRTQSIYYRGDAILRAPNDVVIANFDRIPWERIPEDAVRIMLRRYADERRQGRFRIYSGDHERGEVLSLGMTT